MVVLNIYKLHRNKKFWGDDADLFIPERFEPRRMENIHPFAYLPFAGEFKKFINFLLAIEVR